MVELIKWILGIESLDGLGTELGIANSVTLFVFFLLAVTVAWLSYHRISVIKANVKPVYKRDIGELVERLDELWESRESDEEREKRAALDKKLLEMWKEHEYQKRRDQSDQLNLDPKAIQVEIANQVARLLAKEGK